MPVLLKYQRILQSIRELKRLIEELEKAEVGAVDPQRKQFVLDRWRTQLDVSI
jgi:hypothetical protein